MQILTGKTPFKNFSDDPAYVIQIQDRISFGGIFFELEIPKILSFPLNQILQRSIFIRKDIKKIRKSP